MPNAASSHVTDVDDSQGPLTLSIQSSSRSSPGQSWGQLGPGLRYSEAPLTLFSRILGKMRHAAGSNDINKGEG